MIFIYDTLRGKKVIFFSLCSLFYAMNNYTCLLDNTQRPTLNIPNTEDNLQLKVITVNLDIIQAGQIIL